MTAELLARLGGPVAAGGLAMLVLASPRPARLAGLGLWAVGMALFLPLLVPSENRAAVAAGAVVGVALTVALALLFRRWPWALPFLVLAAVPARFPVTVGDTSANLLVPLYALVAGAAVALGWSLWRDEPRRRELGALSWPLALLVLWLGLSALWTSDPKEAAIELFFFVVPFALLALALARLPWSDLGLAWLSRLLVAMALVVAAVGVWQWMTRGVFWNPKVIEGNAFAPFYRVNSVFWDPSSYGRFLVVAILVALGLVLFGVWRRLDVPLTLTIAALWVALIFSFSQSSFTALFAGVVLAAAIAWRWRAAVAVGLLAAVMIPVGVAAPQLDDVRERLIPSSSDRLNRATSGRFKLETNGLRIAADHPLGGVGVGGFEHAYRERVKLRPQADDPASHNTPVAVVAEAGAVGLVLFAWLVGAALVVAFRRTQSERASVRIVGRAAGLALFAVFVHSLFYDAFLEDPMVWGLFALAALAARQAGSPAGVKLQGGPLR
jgi:O-antigen ligase